MKTITIGSGAVVSQEEFVKLNAPVYPVSAASDDLTEFLATKHDLITLRNGLVKEIGDSEYFLELTVSRSDIADHNWLTQRLARLLDFVPELEEETNKLLAAERAKVKKDAEAAENKMKNEAEPSSASGAD
jgi:hypothetical protein